MIHPGKPQRALFLDRWQVRLGTLVFACWLVLLAILVTADKSPQLGDWAEPAHFFSSVFLAVAVAGLLIARGLAVTATRLGWLTLIIVVVIVVLLELLQQVSVTRAFQLQDIIDGVAGGAIGAIVSAVLFHRLGGSRFFVISLVQSVVVMLVVTFLSTAESSRHCDVPSNVAFDWSQARIENFHTTDDGIAAGNAVFCEFRSGVVTRDGELVLDGGALVSAPLHGLLDALAASGQITFAIRFKSATTEQPTWPGVVAALIRDDKSFRPLARVSWYARNLAAVVRLNHYEGTSTSMAKRVTSRYHEVAIVYDGEWQTTYFDGEAVGFERTILDPADPQGKVTMELGWRSDDRWQPFHGVIQSIVISATAMSAAQVGGLFTDLSHR